MKKIIFLALAFMLSSEVNALEVKCIIYLVKQSSCSTTTAYKTFGSTDNSSSSTATCYVEYANNTGSYEITGYRKYITGLSCNAGYAKKAQAASSICIGSPTANPGDVIYYTCECSDTYSWNNNWTNYATIYQRDVGTKTNCGTSSIAYRYRCGPGFYSASGQRTAIGTTNGLNCTACPANATCDNGGLVAFTCDKGYYKDGSGCTSCEITCGVGHTTDAAGATSSSACKAPADVEIRDDAGIFVYTQACCCGESCISSLCPVGTTSCSTSADCKFGYTCTNGCCKSKIMVSECLSDSDCLLANQYCNVRTGECVDRAVLE